MVRTRATFFMQDDEGEGVALSAAAAKAVRGVRASRT